MNPDTVETPLIDWTEWEANNRMKDLEFLKKLARVQAIKEAGPNA